MEVVKVKITDALALRPSLPTSSMRADQHFALDSSEWRVSILAIRYVYEYVYISNELSQ